MSVADALPPGQSDRFPIVKFASITIISLVIVSPLFLLVVASLKPDRFQILAEMGSFKAFWVKNYADVLPYSGNQPFGRYLMNSVIVLTATLAGGMLFNSMAAFVLAWGRIPGRALVLTLMIGLYIVPQESIVLPLLNLVNGVGLADSFSAQILPFLASPLYVFLLYQFFLQVPRDLYDAARVDGASPFEIYWRVFLPISLPALATVAILLGIESWNQYLWPLMVTQTDYARPISVGIAGFFGADSIYWNLAMSASVIMMAPVLAFYLMFQKWFVSSVISSGVKG
jgi:multiple sugar transport system permease protein